MTTYDVTESDLLASADLETDIECAAQDARRDTSAPSGCQTVCTGKQNVLMIYWQDL